MKVKCIDKTMLNEIVHASLRSNLDFAVNMNTLTITFYSVLDEKDVIS